MNDGPIREGTHSCAARPMARRRASGHVVDQRRAGEREGPTASGGGQGDDLRRSAGCRLDIDPKDRGAGRQGTERRATRPSPCPPQAPRTASGRVGAGLSGHPGHETRHDGARGPDPPDAARRRTRKLRPGGGRTYRDREPYCVSTRKGTARTGLTPSKAGARCPGLQASFSPCTSIAVGWVSGPLDRTSIRRGLAVSATGMLSVSTPSA
jgi:hypothetical protein